MSAENKPESLREQQYAFAAHIRNPDINPSPDGIEDRRMKIYRELFFNNLQSMLAGNFPVLHSLYDSADWSALVRDFYTEHRCHTPLFPEIPREFLQYLQDERNPRPEDPLFLHELAHYEWVELALSLDERQPFEDAEAATATSQGDILDSTPTLSPLAWPLSYSWPVHRIRPDSQPTEPPSEATHLLVYRDRSDDVRFMQLNAVSRLLIALMQEEESRTGLELLNEVARQIQHPDTDRVIEGGKQLLEEFLQKDILLGK